MQLLPMWSTNIHSTDVSQTASRHLPQTALENTRRMREKLTNFSFQVKWVKGKTHMIADALSRTLVFQPEEEEDETIETAIHCLPVRETSKLMDIEEAIDEHYNTIVLAIKPAANFKQLPGHHPARKLLNVCDQLSLAKLGETDVKMLDGRRIVVPKGARQNKSRNSTTLTQA